MATDQERIDIGEWQKRAAELHHKMHDPERRRRDSLLSVPVPLAGYYAATGDLVKGGYPGHVELGKLLAGENVNWQETRYIDVRNSEKSVLDIGGFWFWPASGVAVVREARKGHDKSTSPLFMSEIFFQSWQKIVAGSLDSLRRLRIVGLDTIINEPTIAAIDVSSRTSTYTRKDENQDSGYRVYSQIDRGFFTILGSPLGMMIARALDAHRVETEYLWVEKIVVAKTGDWPSRSSQNCYFVLAKANPSPEEKPEAEAAQE